VHWQGHEDGRRHVHPPGAACALGGAAELARDRDEGLKLRVRESRGAASRACAAAHVPYCRSLDCGTSLTPLVSCEAKRAAAVIYATERLLIEASRAKADVPLPA